MLAAAFGAVEQILLLEGQAAHSAPIRERGATRKSPGEPGEREMEEPSCMVNKELYSQEQARKGWTWRFSPWDPKLASVTLPCDPVVSIPLQSHLFVPFFLQLEVGGVRGMTKPCAIRFFSLFLLYLTSVTLCPDLPLQVAAQVAQFLGTRHSYSSGNIEGHWECVKGWF